ncbi:MAG: ATP-binding protein [Planctomycetota bacterium]|nr:MAG: ATP-binding protein [Planctomycetota bacterium]REK21662.1 MAG: ATP-binding protein [Planctomycetota bacterium]REK32777.1 MAG: ATP-binding protein [Planctomycetota bacterium]
MNDADWRTLVDEIFTNGNATDVQTINHLLRLNPNQEAEAVAARSNMTRIVRMLHDPSSQMMDMLIASLKEGKICVIDISQMRGTPALVLSGLLLQRVFDHNQEEFTKATPETIPTLAVVEEAQSVLGSGGSSGEGPYVAWVKEGRKYDLGAVLITQQPGSISHEILSQGDNWFIFHLLSAGDLVSVKKANAHFSDDILSTLLNEPIPGHGVFWSSAGGKSYPIPLRVLSFEQAYSARDPQYNLPAGKTFSQELKGRFQAAISASRTKPPSTPEAKPESQTGGLFPAEAGSDTDDDSTADTPEDVLATYSKAAIEKVAGDTQFMQRMRSNGMPWKGVVTALEEALPDVLDDRNNIAYQLVPQFLQDTFGEQDTAWETERRPRKSGSGTTTWIVIK